jgi:predicted TIM-barrel fold metal-dependent hydrolase
MIDMIDMHAHWRPAEVADALRARTKEPRIMREASGAEVLRTRMGDEPLATAFDDVDAHLARMDRQGVQTSVLSVIGSFCWIESQPLDVSGPLCRRVNDRFSEICAQHPGRFAAFAALPLADLAAAAEELDRVMTLPGMIGAQLPGNYFLTRKDAEATRRSWSRPIGITRCCSFIMARGRAMRSRNLAARRTMRAGATARWICKPVFRP